MTARELEAAMIHVFGPDFRDKAITSPLGVIPLAGCFDECGLVDPHPISRESGSGIWQWESGS